MSERHNKGGPHDNDPEAISGLVQAFRDEGLLWMVNTAVLHPRGWALQVVAEKETGRHIGLTLSHEDGAYHFFSPGEPASDGRSILDHWEEAERDRGLSRDHSG